MFYFVTVFYSLYALAGLTNMLDGFIARKLHTVSRFGSVLDTVADICFVSVCLVKLIPSLAIPPWFWIWLTLILLIKLTNIIVGFVIRKTMVAEHTTMNKITGLLLFLFPFVMPMVDLEIEAAALCTVAIVAAIQEGYSVF